LPSLGGSALAEAINVDGEIVGSSDKVRNSEADFFHPVVWKDGAKRRGHQRERPDHRVGAA
jgi:hypothetical protein